MKRIVLVAAMFLSIAPLASQAVLISHGTGEAVTLRQCFSSGTSACDYLVEPLGPPDIIVYGGLPGATSSSASVSDPAYGSAFGSVALSGTIGAPILKASATSEAGKRANTNSVALQRYTYTGTETTTRTFGGTLTYRQTETGIYPPFIGDGVNAIIDVFTLPVEMIEVGDTAKSNFEALRDVVVRPHPGYISLGFDQYTNAPATDAGLTTLGVTVTLNPGDTVWVWAWLQTPAVNGGYVDASQTLITSWDNPANLVPAATVAEPGTLALLGLGLAGLAASRRRRKEEPRPDDRCEKLRGPR